MARRGVAIIPGSGHRGVGGDGVRAPGQRRAAPRRQQRACGEIPCEGDPGEGAGGAEGRRVEADVADVRLPSHWCPLEMGTMESRDATLMSCHTQVDTLHFSHAKRKESSQHSFNLLVRYSSWFAISSKAS